MSNQTDTLDSVAELLPGCLNNDRSSQSRLYALLAPAMMGVCLRYSKSREEAEEVLQEGFMQVFKAIRQFRGEGPFEAWVRRIMVNCALRKLRSRPQMTAIVSFDSSFEGMADKEYIFPEMEAKELIRIIQQLPPMYRAVFNLYVFEGMKHREIAEILGISEGTSKSNLSDARNLLQRAVSKNRQIAKLNNL